MEKLWTGKHISELPFKCKYCGYIGQIYPMHYCSAIKGMRDIGGNLATFTIPLTEEERKEWDLIHKPTILQRIVKRYKEINDWCFENPLKGYFFVVMPIGTIILIPIIYLMVKLFQ